MAKQSFMHGAIVLAAAGGTTKMMGMMIQVVIARELGAQGFGLFQTINPIFFMLLTISTLALPAALSKVIAENLALGNAAKVRRALWVAHITVVVLSLTVCLGAIAFAPEISNRWLDPRGFLPLVGAILRIPVVCLSSIMSGYYMGTQNQGPPAAAWIIETAVRTIVTIPLILALNPHGIGYGALAVMIGAGIGESAGYLYMLWRYLTRDKRLLIQVTPVSGVIARASGTIRDLVEVALPTTITNLCGIVAYAAEPVIIYIAFAHVGIARTQATALYGSFGMAAELLFLPTVLSSSISSVVIPAVSEAAAMQNERLVSRRLNQVIQATFMIALPSTVFFILSGHDLAHSLYKDHLAGSLLAYLAPTCVFIYILDPLSAILQGLNKALLSTVVTMFTSCIRMLCIYYFVGQAGQGIFGVATSIAISGIVATFLSLYFLRELVSMSINFLGLAKLVIATGLAAVPIHEIQSAFAAVSPLLQVTASLVLGSVVYLLAILYLRVLPIRTIHSIPWVGPTIARLLLHMPFVS
ncbi:oligosaccharide flippase family protein [Alicyclobacillus fastidiosus]|uniref:Oligosaccharide flippase family protein n=1 Tax=Alicyclobacillus fastidiosus TaxID=392011 RepID=A0ABY6ZMM2_9BACL|nr:oligosaccharide flippase family protein [Alicyclobacillus fastidiosus]WAH44188.1 oligosaccharide flippase family protein [Alicyclobacillus fastidiosus]